MKKLSLRLDELLVESFATSPPEESRGTVYGLTVDPDTCPTYDGGCSESTCGQVMCGCTAGPGPGAGSCDITYCGSCDDPTCYETPYCPTAPGSPGC